MNMPGYRRLSAMATVSGEDSVVTGPEAEWLTHSRRRPGCFGRRLDDAGSMPPSMPSATRHPTRGERDAQCMSKRRQDKGIHS